MPKPNTQGDYAVATNDSDAAVVETEAGPSASSEKSDAQNGDSPDTPRAGMGRKKHGRGFVYIGLGDCDDALRKIDSHAKTMSIDQFASALGHPAPKGRFLQKLDALKAFGLIDADTSESVTLSQLAEEMLYGAVKAKARTTAFLNYADFKRLYVDFPKAHDNLRADVVNFIRAKLGIVNEVERFLRLFLESAEYAGLLEGAADSESKFIRLRAAPMSPNGAVAPDAGMGTTPVGDLFSVMAADEVDDLLDAAGLTEFKQRAEVRQRTTGQYTLTVADGGKITIEINRPVQITVRPENLLTDLPKIIEAMQQKGLRA
jgi:hypothetical protein